MTMKKAETKTLLAQLAEVPDHRKGNVIKYSLRDHHHVVTGPGGGPEHLGERHLGSSKHMANGKVAVAFSRFLGYDRGEDGSLVINQEEAKVIRLIYGEFLSGLSFNAIAQKLTAQGIKTPGGKDKWSQGTVKSILMKRRNHYEGLFH